MNLEVGKTYKICYGRGFDRLAQYVRDRTWTISPNITARFHLFVTEDYPIELLAVHSDRLEVWVSDL